MRRFHLQRDEDATGTSGIGTVAEGVVFANGKVALSWLTPISSVAICDAIGHVEHIHGHGGKTRVVWEE